MSANDILKVLAHIGNSQCEVAQHRTGPQCVQSAKWELSTFADAEYAILVLMVCNRHIKLGLEALLHTEDAS